MENEPKRLYRSRADRVLVGVLSGVGDYFEVDPTLIRAVFLLLLVLTGFAPFGILYIILWFIIPEVPSGPETGVDYKKKFKKRIKITKALIIILIILILISFIGLAARFFYHNVIIPWPYRDELRGCLDDAKYRATETERYSARNDCFRIYPHFL